MAGHFSDKVVVVTGASRGIGRGIALAFAREGAQTVLAARSADNLAKAAGEIAREGARPDTIAGDLGTEAACRAVYDRVAQKYGRCDVLVNSAGATKAGSFLDQPDADWIEGFALKFFGCVRLCRLFWPMLKEAQGFIVNIAGGAARTPDSAFLVGGSVNAAMTNFTKGLSRLGMRDGVNVNAVLPGITETDRVNDLIRQRAAATGISLEEARRATVEKAGTKRIGTVDDMAALTLFLCSEAARHIQGVGISVDGGATPGHY